MLPSRESRIRVLAVAGARPNFMKIAPIVTAAHAHPEIHTTLVHTGQHYDERMSDLFFRELGLPAPDIHLGVGSASHAVQTARIMAAFDEILDTHATDVVAVVGDVNSTLACALVAVKRLIKVAHVEAGLRSFDRTMPEEINRVLTDQISDYLFTTERTAHDHLHAEGVPDERIHFVGNVMIDTLLRNRERAKASDALARHAVEPRGYALCTLHRPSNVDTPEDARNTVAALRALATRLPVILPLHPRSQLKLGQFGLLDEIVSWGRVQIVDPLGYLDFLALMDNARLVFTDSGGIQEETTALGVPCMTFRENTERPITVTQGTNQVVGLDPSRVARATDQILAGHGRSGRVPELWDGHAAERIVATLLGQHADLGRRTHGVELKPTASL
jgi:UDP-N-acetylglucosamine 2-epimerase (non-hydrolysing)